jgi:hypothetical protein
LPARARLRRVEEALLVMERRGDRRRLGGAVDVQQLGVGEGGCARRRVSVALGAPPWLIMRSEPTSRGRAGCSSLSRCRDRRTRRRWLSGTIASPAPGIVW